MEVCIKHVTENGKKLLNGWEHWSLEYVNRTYDALKEPGYGVASVYVGQFVFNVLLKAANDLKIPFNMIEEIVYKTLSARVGCFGQNPFEDFVVTSEEREAGCNFFKALVKHREEDSRYFGLIYKILTHQSGQNKTYPVGFQMARCKGLIIKCWPNFFGRCGSDLISR